MIMPYALSGWRNATVSAGRPCSTCRSAGPARPVIAGQSMWLSAINGRQRTSCQRTSSVKFRYLGDIGVPVPA